MCSGMDRDANFACAEQLLAKAVEEGAELALLPENFPLMGGSDYRKRKLAEHQAESPTLRFLSEQARRCQLSIVGGSFLLRGEDGLIRNACPVFDADGRLLRVYNKIHLFDMDFGGESYRESALIEPGRSPAMIRIGEFNAGLSICYDIRFPELFRHYSSRGCHIICLVAAFTEPTGKGHWQSLLRARAIENQCYVLASAQWGEHPDRRRTWGHSMIVDPWGEILAELPDGEGVITVNVLLDNIKSIRQSLPTLKHRRLSDLI
jgi:nitrilase